MKNPDSNPKSTCDEKKPLVADRLIGIGKDCAARLEEPFRSADHRDLLYRKDGLPSDRWWAFQPPRRTLQTS